MQLRLGYPVDPVHFSQHFGVCSGESCEIYKGLGLAGHNGIDFKAVHGQLIYAAHDGVVTFTGEDSSAGYGVVIRTHERFDYNNKSAYFKTIYWHIMTTGTRVKAGQSVKRGDIIALADNTGLSTGDHLHFGLKPVYAGERTWEWYNVEQNNGFKGAIDPTSYFDELTNASSNQVSSADTVAILGAKEIAKGNTRLANLLFAIANLIRSFMK